MVELHETAKRENPLLKRVELEFVLHHPGETTPQRDAVREIVASKLGGNKGNVIIDWLDTEYGRASTKGYAKLYESAEVAKATEPQHILVRNGLAKKEEAA